MALPVGSFFYKTLHVKTRRKKPELCKNIQSCLKDLNKRDASSCRKDLELQFRGALLVLYRDHQTMNPITSLYMVVLC